MDWPTMIQVEAGGCLRRKNQNDIGPIEIQIMARQQIQMEQEIILIWTQQQIQMIMSEIAC